MNDITLVLLTSTRQHWGLIDIDKITTIDILKKSEIIKNSYKLVHIKAIPGDEKILQDKIEWFKNKGFNVIYTIKDWQNDHQSHGLGLIEDIQKVYNNYQVNTNPYIFHLENDWIFNTSDLDNLINKSINILNRDNQVIYHRYTRQDQSDIIDRLEAQYKYHINCHTTDKEFSFNPFIARTRDMKYISNFVLKNHERIHPHCEMAYELAAKYLLGDATFSFTHNQIVEHLGTKEFAEKNNIA